MLLIKWDKKKVKMKKLTSIEELRKICQPEDTDQTPLGMTYRSISIYITKLFLYTPITPNQITLLGGAVYIGGAALFILGSPLMIIIGGLVVRAAILLDYVDGNVARYRGKSSPEGAFLDKLSDSIPQIFLFIFLAFGIYQDFPHILVFAIGCIALMSILLKTLVELCQDDTLLKMVLKQGLKPGETSIRHQETGRPDEGLMEKMFSVPQRVISRISSSLHYPYHTVDLFIVAAVIDIILELGFPAITIPFSIVFYMLTSYAVLSLLDAIARVTYIVKTRHIQFLYALLSATGTDSDNASETPDCPLKSPGDVSRHEP